MLTAVRVELNDSGGTPLWASALLNSYIVDAIKEYSRELPEEAAADLSVTADVETVTLPARFVKAIRVEQPDGVLRWPLTTQRTYEATLGGLSELVDFESRVGESSGKPGYRIWAGSLVLDPAPGETDATGGRMEYLRTYALPAADGDTLATPTEDDDLLLKMVCARALDWISTDEAKRQRYERSRGASTEGTAGSYRKAVAEEFARRRSVLRTTTLELSE